MLAWWHRIEGNNRQATSAFRKALELDPFHARIVTGSLEHFRLTGDREMTTRLFERLAQIAPETGEDTSLAEVSALGRLNNLVTRFVATADESIVEEYATELAKNIGQFAHPHAETLSRLRLMQFRHDMNGILDVTIEALPEALQWEHFLAYMVANDIVLAAQRLAGRSADAAATARRIIEAQRDYAHLFDPDSFLPGVRFAAAAIVTLEDKDTMRTLGDALFDVEGRLIDDYAVASHVAMSRLDLDRAVELILAQKARHPS